MTPLVLLVAASACMPLTDLKKAAPGSTFIQLSARQFFFMEGVSAVLPNTPAGLPEGADSAWLARQGDSGMVVFAQGKPAKVCLAPINAPKALIKLLDEVEHGRGDAL